jgi:hypothetical protein
MGSGKRPWEPEGLPEPEKLSMNACFLTETRKICGSDWCRGRKYEFAV